MKRIFKLLYIFILCFIFIPFVNAEPKYDKVTDTSLKIYDFGEYLTEADIKQFKQKIDEFIKTYKMDLVIVTKKDYDFNGMKDYAQDFYDYNHFGTDNVKSGIILFYNVDSEGPAVWMTTSGSAILYYDDARIDAMKRNMSSVKGQGHKAVINRFITDAINYAKQGIPESNKYAYIDEEGNYKIDTKKQEEETLKLEKELKKKAMKTMCISSIVTSLLISTVVIVVLVHKNKTIRKEKNASIYLDKSSINIYNLVDQFVSTHTSKTYIPPSDSSSSGSSSHHHSSGGSSTWSGSSGTSHGGGGGRL